jgi:uncharacterized membrane-anchored protein
MTDSNNKFLIGIVVLVLPILVLTGMALKSATSQQVGQQIWQVKIAGYDPRDLLYGHYLRFQYDWNMEGNRSVIPSGYKGNVCMCLNSSDTGYKNPTAYPVQCEVTTPNMCESSIKVYKHGVRYSLNRNEAQERYFIPEENAYEIDMLFRRGEADFYVEFMAHEDHSVSVRDLYVDGMPLRDYLKNMPKEEKK